ncbi:MAG: hypothetical protein R3B07_07775 [Polyangiaceae bacterium]
MSACNLEAFARLLDATGKPLWSVDTYATASEEYTNGVWLDLQGNLYAVGHDQTIGNNEAFVTKLAP